MQSMTGFAAIAGEAEGRRWRWEAKSVNGRGLDLRFRLNDGFDLDEAALRARAGKRLSRGSVTVSLREESGAAGEAPRLNEAALAAVIEAARTAEVAAAAAGLALAPPTAAALLAHRGVMEMSATDAVDAEAVGAVLLADFDALIEALAASRAEEGARLHATVAGLIDRIEALSTAAAAAFAAQQEGAPARLAEKVAALLDAGAETPPERLAQELALLAVKADIREELDRLTGHVAAARDLIAASGPVGRKLDFLTQEFNREANTLCSKSGSPELTQIGLDLKVVIDQLREQAQNVE